MEHKTIKSKRIIPFGQDKIKFYMDFNSGYKIINKYVPILFNNFTSNNFKLDPSFGAALEFDGVLERIEIPVPQLDINPNEKFTVFIRFKILTIVDNDIIFGRINFAPSGEISINIQGITTAFVLAEDGFATTFIRSITADLNWHEALMGFDGTTWFIEIDGTRYTNGVNSHAGFIGNRNWNIGSFIAGIRSCNCQVSEIGMIIGASL